MNTHVAVIIPAAHAAGTILDALASVNTQQHVVEICVACHDDATRQVAETFRPTNPAVTFTVIDNPSGTTPDALNACIDATRAPIVARLDAHATFTDGYLAHAVAVLNDDTIGNVGGVQQASGTGKTGSAVAAAMASPAGSGGAAYRGATTPKDVDTVYLGVFRRDALNEVGGFNPACVRNQDAELNIRLRKAGWRVRFDPAVVATYRPRETLGALARQYHDYGRWRRFTHQTTGVGYGPRQLAVPSAVVILMASIVVTLATLNVAWLLPVGAYGATVLVAAAFAARNHPGTRLRDTSRIALVLCVMHLSWGSGFMRGAPKKATR